MNRQTIIRLQGEFDQVDRKNAESEAECWLAHDLQKVLACARSGGFETVIEKAIKACEKAGQRVEDHFARARKMVEIRSSAS